MNSTTKGKEEKFQSLEFNEGDGSSEGGFPVLLFRQQDRINKISSLSTSRDELLIYRRALITLYNNLFIYATDELKTKFEELHEAIAPKQIINQLTRDDAVEALERYHRCLMQILDRKQQLFPRSVSLTIEQ